MINKLSVRNFKSLRAVDIDLERFTVFVGANGSGKSSILQAVDLLCQSFRSQDQHQTAFRTAKAPNEALSSAATRGSDSGVEVIIQTGRSGFRVLQTPELSSDMPVPNRKRTAKNDCSFSPDIDSHQWQPWNSVKPAATPPRSVLLRLERTNLMRSIPNGNSGPGTVPGLGMAADGNGLHTVLANMTLNDPDTWLKLQEELSQIVPIIRRLRHTMGAPNKPSELLFDTVGADSLTASEVSEGTLLVLGILAAFHAPDRPNLIMLDDLDQGLHPKAQRDLIALLRHLLNGNPDLQILASTHSPYMLDCMEANEVRMTYLEGGATICAPLTRHPKFQKWKDEMHSGELWSLFGEKWIAEQPAADTVAVDGSGA